MPGLSRSTMTSLRCRAVAAAVFLSLAFVTGAPAQSGLLTSAAPVADMQTSVELFEDWQVICDQAQGAQGGKSTCSMAIAGATKATDGRTVGIRLSQLPVTNRSDALFAIETPLDLLLSKGIEMRVDGGPLMRLAFRSCHTDGCLAPFSLNSKVERQFRNGQALSIRVFDLNGKPVEVRLSLLGFTAAERRAGI